MYFDSFHSAIMGAKIGAEVICFGLLFHSML